MGVALINARAHTGTRVVYRYTGTAPQLHVAPSPKICFRRLCIYSALRLFVFWLVKMLLLYSSQLSIKTKMFTCRHDLCYKYSCQELLTTFNSEKALSSFTGELQDYPK